MAPEPVRAMFHSCSCTNTWGSECSAANGERQKATFHVSHCAEAQPSPWCHQAEDAAYSLPGELGAILQITLLHIKKSESITHFAEETCSVLLSNVQLKTTWSGMDLWVKESSRKSQDQFHREEGNPPSLPANSNLTTTNLHNPHTGQGEGPSFHIRCNRKTFFTLQVSLQIYIYIFKPISGHKIP